MNSLVLVVLVSCPPVAVYPDADPAYGDSSSQQGRHRLFGRLRGHRHDKECPCAGNGQAGGSWSPVIAAPAPGVEAGKVEAVTLQPAPTVVPSPACHCAGNGHAGGSRPAVAVAPAPTVVSPPATAWPAPRLVARPRPVTSSAELPLAAPPDGVPRQMPRGPMATTGDEPPRN
jgi:hypothetical protein